MNCSSRAISWICFMKTRCHRWFYSSAFASVITVLKCRRCVFEKLEKSMQPIKLLKPHIIINVQNGSLACKYNMLSYLREYSLPVDAMKSILHLAMYSFRPCKRFFSCRDEVWSTPMQLMLLFSSTQSVLFPHSAWLSIHLWVTTKFPI